MYKYRIIDHPSDMGIEVAGKDKKELFENAAFGMFDVMFDLKHLDPGRYILSYHDKVSVKADNIESLLVSWLSELLYIADSKKIQLTVFSINKMTDKELEATVLGGKIERVKTGVKAVTYSQMKIENTGSRLQTRIIFDV